MSPRVVCIVQARMGSSRLPGKVLRPLGNQTVLEHVLRRADQARLVDEVVVAAPVGVGDDPVAELCSELGFRCTRGSEDDVLSRYHDAALQSSADVIVRVTSDCPFIDPDILDAVVVALLRFGFDYARAGAATGIARGLDVEAITSAALDRLLALPLDGAEREHVTMGVYRRPELFSIAELPTSNDDPDEAWRLCIDEQVDYDFALAALEQLGRGDHRWPSAALYELLREKPTLAAMNGNVDQKAVAPVLDRSTSLLIEIAVSGLEHELQTLATAWQERGVVLIHRIGEQRQTPRRGEIVSPASEFEAVAGELRALFRPGRTLRLD